MEPNREKNQDFDPRYPAPPQNVQPPLQPLNTPRQPQQSVTGAENPYCDQQVQPGQVIGYGLPTDQQVYGTTAPRPPSKIKLTFIALVMLVLLLALIGGAIYGIGMIGNLSSQNNAANIINDENIEQLNPQVPEDWDVIDTDYDFSIKAPSGWELGDGNNSTFGDIESKTAIIAENNEDEVSDEGEPLPTPAQNSLLLSVGSHSLPDGGDQAKFEESLKGDARKKAYAELFGIGEDEVKITNKKVKIGDREWIQLDVTTPQAITRSYYHWVNDRAVSVSLVETSPDRTKFEDNIKKYLQPAAASADIYDEDQEE